MCFYEFASSETKSKNHLFLYSPSIKFNSLWQTHNSTSFCTVPVSSSMAHCKLTTAPISVQSQFQVQWLKANSQQHLFLYSPSVKLNGSWQNSETERGLERLWQIHNSTSFCTVPVSSSMAYGKLTTAPHSVQSQCQVIWLMANS